MAEMKGLGELLANIDLVGDSVRNAGRGAANAAAQVVKREAVVIARDVWKLVETGALVNNIAVKQERGTAPTWFEYHVGVRHGKEAKGAQKIAVRGHDGSLRFEYVNDPFYWHMWELGHYNVFLRRFVAAKPFIRGAMMAKEALLVDVMRDYLVARVEKFADKALAA